MKVETIAELGLLHTGREDKRDQNVGNCCCCKDIIYIERISGKYNKIDYLIRYMWVYVIKFN